MVDPDNGLGNKFKNVDGKEINIEDKFKESYQPITDEQLCFDNSSLNDLQHVNNFNAQQSKKQANIQPLSKIILKKKDKSNAKSKTKSKSKSNAKIKTKIKSKSKLNQNANSKSKNNSKNLLKSKEKSNIKSQLKKNNYSGNSNIINFKLPPDSVPPPLSK